MKLSCTQENLSRGLGLVGRSVGTRATLPVLNNILLQTDKGRLKLSATDLEIGIHTWIGAKVDVDGGITIPARLLMDYVNNNTDKTINLELKESTLHLESEHFKANIKGIEASEFPLIPEVSKNVSITVSSAEFSKAINRTVIATALDESRPVLAGVYFYNCKAISAERSSHNDVMKAVATDSYRLAEQTIAINKGTSELKDFAFIVPQRTVSELGRIITDKAEKIQIYPGENQVEFMIEETILVSRLIEGTFPDYAQIIPKSTTTKAEIATPEFNNAIKMASLFARESANNIKLKITSPDKLEVLATSAHIGDNVSQISANVTGDNLEIAFNAKFIMDCLAVIDSDKVNLELSNTLSPGLLKSPKDPNYLYVIMPLRVDE